MTNYFTYLIDLFDFTCKLEENVYSLCQYSYNNNSVLQYLETLADPSFDRKWVNIYYVMQIYTLMTQD